MSRSPRWAHRAAALVAGGGLTAAGLAGPLASATTAQNPASEGILSTDPALDSQAPASSPVASEPRPAPATSTATSPPAAKVTPLPVARPGAAPTTRRAPKVSAHHGQASTGGRLAPTASAPASGPAKSARPPAPRAALAPPPGAPNGIALPPQLVANRFGVLPGSATSTLTAQALRFYRIPLFLLPIYQAAGIQYGVPWQVLAAINEVETDYGHDLAVSSAGAVGWMQFLPETWLQYGVDANHVGFADPYNPADAIFAAARYLRAAGAATDLRGAIFAYNHSTAYVSSVLLRAQLVAGYPEAMISSLSGLAQGRLPVVGGQPATSASSTRHGLRFVEIRGSRGAAVVAAQDSRVVALGRSPAWGRYVVLRDLFGDEFTYAGLGTVSDRFASPAIAPPPASAPAATRARPARSGSAGDPRPAADPRPAGPATAGAPVTLAPQADDTATAASPASPATAVAAPPASATTATAPPTTQVRIFAHPRPQSAAAAAPSAPPKGTRWVLLRRGALVTPGTRLGTVHDAPGGGFMRFAVQPAGDPRTVDPRPILANWRLLAEATHPAADGSDRLLADTTADVFLMSAGELERQVLADPTISIYGRGRQDIARGDVDGRVLAALAFLSRSGLKPTVSTLQYASALVPSHGVEISAINGIPVAGHQGGGSVVDAAVRTLLTLQGRFIPHQIVSLMSYPQAPNTVARTDHADHISIVFRAATPDPGAHPASASTPRAAGAAAVAPPPAAVGASARVAGGSTALAPAAPAPPLNESGWNELVARLAAIPAPAVPATPSAAAVRDGHSS